MSSLASQSATTAEFPILNGSSNIAAFSKALTDHLASNYGTVGQNILNSTTTTLRDPGTACPHYDDPRIHPNTLQPIPNTRKYLQVNLTRDEAAEGAAFDRSTLALTEASSAALNHDVVVWRKLSDTYNRDLEKYRTQDDSLLNFLLAHISRDALEIITANPLTTAYKTLPATCIDRASQYIAIINNQFAHGNSTVSINELSKFLALTQGPVSSDPTAAFCNRLTEQYSRILPLLAHARTVEALTLMLLSMVFIKGLNKSHPPSLRALEIHVQTYPGDDSLDHFAELRARVLAAQDSDLSNIIQSDAISEQSSALLSTPNPSSAASSNSIPPAATAITKPYVKGLRKPNRSDHCPYCLNHFRMYFYHPEAACVNKQQRRTAATAASGGRRATTQLAARSADIELPPFAPAGPVAQLSHSQLLSFLASQGIDAHFEESIPPPALP